MLQAEQLHRDVALLSNKLHQFSDNDIEGVKPIIDAIIEKRQAWKDVRIKINHIEKFGKLPEEKTVIQFSADEKASMAELQVQLLNCQNLIRNKRYKLKNNPNASNSERWKEEIAVLQLQENELQSQLIAKKYEKS
jgi:hypothetical protein